MEEEKIDPANSYALSKLMGEQLCTFMQIILIFLISELVFLIQLATWLIYLGILLAKSFGLPL